MNNKNENDFQVPGSQSRTTDNQAPVTGPQFQVPDTPSLILRPEIAISVKNISKSFRMYNSPAERLKELLHPFKKKYHKDFWALRDISLEIPKGTTFGIIGQNGSGKSTLLQIICGILQPTAGSVQVNGRISALLELGAGFNRDFTGRENIFMNSAVSGISRREMEGRFDQIAEFADIGHFIDQPVKTYSSGMYVRLAFALAINVDPDILIVDEALAVGDIKFQRKCFAKIEQFKKEGKTILFVSHSLESVNLLCDTAVLIQKSQLLGIGKPKEITRKFQQIMLGEENLERNTRNINGDELERIRLVVKQNLKNKKTDKKVEIIEYGILDRNGKKVNLLETGEPYTFFSRALIYKPVDILHLGYPVKTVKGLLLFGINNEVQKVSLRRQQRGDLVEGRLDVRMWLAPGHYFASFRAGIWMGEWEEMYDEIQDFHFIVAPDNRITRASIVNLEPRLYVRNILREVIRKIP